MFKNSFQIIESCKKFRKIFLNRKDLFELAKNQSNVFIYVSFFQIYMEHINDLIGKDKKSNLKINVNINFFQLIKGEYNALNREHISIDYFLFLEVIVVELC